MGNKFPAQPVLSPLHMNCCGPMSRIPYLALVTVAQLLFCTEIATAAGRPAVVELFTSEGCSSCPPAEAYTAELAQRSDILALTFHVTYWDNLGWPDRFALQAATQRQRTYAESLRLNSVFTPQTVIDGRRSFVGSDRSAIARELLVPRDGPSISLTLRDAELEIGWSAIHAASSGNALLVAYRRSAVTTIGRGENAGRTINEVNVVRSIRTLGPWGADARASHVRIDSLPQDATDVAILLQGEGQSAIVGAATLAIRPEDHRAQSSAAP
jgi:hypothetical protein